MTSYDLNRRSNIDAKVKHGSSFRNKTIMELNNDCLDHVIGFLTPNDLITLGLTDKRFASLAAQRLQIELFNIYKFMEKFSVNEAEKILKKFGSCIRKILLTPQLCSLYNDRSKPYVNLLIEYCRDIKEIHINHVDFRYIEQDLFRWCKNTLEVLDTTKFLSSNGPKCDIAQLGKLKRLNLCLSDITGKEFTTLTHLAYLELAGCKKLESKYLDKVCNNNKLKALDIRYCSLLDSHSFKTIVATQSDSLEEISFCSSYPLGDVTILIKLKRLKRVRISFYGTLKNNTILPQLVKNQKVTIECLKIDRTGSQVNEENELECIRKLSNLSKLELCGFEVSKEFIFKVLQSCKNLSSLFIVPALSNEFLIETRRRYENLKFYG